ncbi:hypothetical protein C8P64_2062 [Christiangramia gaetbulicola]|uniref:Uncharacterized protein n=1 Tax=Christiangramia gaetbulicola TaxID=703340 RepID=A0A2T6AI92_9FLAO|nr:hypothetical protein [Christiangramia gaetbulicola]PTX43534.1 hypothetical protein C8P64_2062 [Christiangramia gaetbulicola]
MVVNKILKKYKLLRSFEVDLNVEKEAFIKELKNFTENGYYTPFLIMLDVFKSENKMYIGNIKSNSFKIRERFKIDNSWQNNFATVKAEFYEENDKLKIKTIIQGMEFFPFILRALIFVIYLVIMFLLVIELLIPPIDFEIEIAFLLPPLMLTIFVGFLTYLPYRIAKNNIVNKKDDLDLIFQGIEKRLTTKN